MRTIIGFCLLIFFFTFFESCHSGKVINVARQGVVTEPEFIVEKIGIWGQYRLANDTMFNKPYPHPSNIFSFNPMGRIPQGSKMPSEIRKIYRCIYATFPKARFDSLKKKNASFRLTMWQDSMGRPMDVQYLITPYGSVTPQELTKLTQGIKSTTFRLKNNLRWKYYQTTPVYEFRRFEYGDTTEVVILD